MKPKRKLENLPTDDLGFYSKKRNLYIFAIAKNCTNSILKNLTDDFVKGSQPRKDADIIVILRDPYQRWISGTVEYFSYTIESDPTSMIKRLDRWLMFPPVKFDYHTEAQSDALIDIHDYTGRKFYYYQDKEVLHYVNAHWNILKKVQHLNTSQDKLRKPFANALRLWAEKNHEKLSSQLELLYKDDYKLIQKSGFVNWPVAGSIL